jgi:3-deoxy-7-phosphoheptulonate synthase
MTLPSYRGDLINRSQFTPAARTPDPHPMLRGYERAALTVNFVRALAGRGFADPHRLEYWDGRSRCRMRGRGPFRERGGP